MQCTSDVTINTARGSTEGPEQHEIQPFPRDPRDLDVGSFYKPVRYDVSFTSKKWSFWKLFIRRVPAADDEFLKKDTLIYSP